MAGSKIYYSRGYRSFFMASDWEIIKLAIDWGSDIVSAWWFEDPNNETGRPERFQRWLNIVLNKNASFRVRYLNARKLLWLYHVRQASPAEVRGSGKRVKSFAKFYPYAYCW